MVRKHNPEVITWSRFCAIAATLLCRPRIGRLDFGCMVLERGASPQVRTNGRIQESCADSDDKPFVPVVFKSMDECNASFLDEKKPTVWWHGSIEQPDGRVVLYLDHVLNSSLK